jgi:DNA gyrase subunit B
MHRIQKLEGLEHVRKRPGMYFGGDDRGLNTCVAELIANSVEHHLAGHCSSIIVSIHTDGSLSVRDDGPGISVTMDLEYKMPFIELAFTTLHSMQGREPKRPYRVMGSSGVGAKCVNAVSEWMTINTVSDGAEYQIEFARGKVKEPLRKCAEPNSRRGTTIRFKPDAQIFGDKTFDSIALTRNLERVAMLHPGLDVWFVDERPNSANRALGSHFLFPNGSADYLNLILQKETRIDPGEPVQITAEEAGIKVNVAFQFSESINTWILSFVNSSESIIGGTHVAGFLRGLTDAVNQFAGQRRRFEPHEVRIGLSAIVGVWFDNPKWARSTRSELINPEVEEVVRKLTFEKVRAWIAEIQGSDDWFIERLDEQRSPNFGLGE